MNVPRFRSASAWVSSTRQLGGSIEIAPGEITREFFPLFAGPSVFHETTTPKSSADCVALTWGFLQGMI